MPTINDAGYFGAGATLPNEGGPVDPPILTGGQAYGSGPDWSFLNRVPSDYSSMFGRLFLPEGGYSPSEVVPDYPAPGTGADNNQNFIRRILSITPQARLGQFLRDKIAHNQALINSQANPGSWQGPPAVPAGGALFGYNPNSGGGGGTPRYNYGTGRVAPTPSTNPIYTTGGPWQSVAGAPEEFRFANNSVTGNYQADQTTKNFELSGGYPATQNYHGTPDSGPNRFYNFPNGPMQVNSEGQLSTVDNVDSGLQTYDPTITTQSRNLYAQALRAVPMDTNGFTAQYVQKVNDWIAAHQPSSIFNLVNPSAPVVSTSISGPPRLPGT